MRWLIALSLFVAPVAFAQEAPADDKVEDKVDEEEAAPADEAAPAETPPAEETPADPAEAEPPPPPPPVEEAPPPPGGDMVNLGVDRELDDRMERCYELIAERKDKAARACLEEVANSEATTAGLVARGVRRAYRLQWDAQAKDEDPAAEARLWMGVTGGVFGLQHGLSLGILLNTNFAGSINPALGILIGGALTIGGSIGYGVLGAWAAEEYGLTAGDAHLLFAGGFWGGVLGAQLATLITFYGRFNDFNTGSNVLTLSQLVGALALGTGALVLERGQMTDGQVSLMNTGGLLGAFIAGMALTTTAAFAPFSEPLLIMAPLMAGQLAGLGAGIFLKDMFDYSWGEVLLLDLGGVIGFLSTGTIILAAGVAGLFNTLGPAGVPIITVGLTAGVVGGYATAGWLINEGKKDGMNVPSPKAGMLPLLSPTVFLDRNQRAAPGMAVGFQF
jgi:hypothetical protein